MAESFADALHQARTAEEQEKQLAEMHKCETFRTASSLSQSKVPSRSMGKDSDSAGAVVPKTGKRSVKCFKFPSLQSKLHEQLKGHN